MSAQTATDVEQRTLKQQINQSLDDIQALILQLGAIATLPKDKRQQGGPSELTALTRLLLDKHGELQTHIDTAPAFARRQACIERLQAEVRRREQCIENVVDTLKQAEHVLITSVFQGNQKLKSVRQAELNRIDLNELMQLTHRISRTNAVAAPHNWKQGDADRPYPTDAEMRQGVLAEMSKEAAMQQQAQQPVLMQHPHHMYRGMSPMSQQQHMASPTAAMAANPMFNRPPHVSPRGAHMMAPPSPFQGQPRMPYGGGVQQNQPLPAFLASGGGRMATPAFPAAGSPHPPPYNQVAGMRPANMPWIPGTSGGPVRPAFPSVGPPITPRQQRAMTPYGQVPGAQQTRPGVSPQQMGNRGMPPAAGNFGQQPPQPSPSSNRRLNTTTGASASSTPPMRVDSVKAPDVEVMTSDSSSSSSSDSEGK